MAFDVGTPEAAAQLWQLSHAELRTALVEAETQLRRSHARVLAVLAEAQSRNLAEVAGYLNLVDLQHDLLHVTPREAQRRLTQAEAVLPRRGLAGVQIPARLPATGQALQEGAIGVDHVDAIVRHLSDLPAAVPPAEVQRAEQTLVGIAGSADARIVAKAGQRFRAWLDQDGHPPSDDPILTGRNELQVVTRSNGQLCGRFTLDAETSALAQTVLSALTAPKPDNPDEPRRSPAERRGEALAEVFRLAADTGQLPAEGGQKPHVTVTIPLRLLQEGVGRATLGDATTLSPQAARYLACDAQVVPAVLGTTSAPLDIGRADRIVPAAIRRALELRDRGCAFPSCDRPAKWTQSHHVVYWSDGGPTSLDNLVLLCRAHHRLVHHSDWEIRMVDGVPVFRPPELIDPQRRPLRNIIHQRE